jgi:hypothetical protein
VAAPSDLIRTAFPFLATHDIAQVVGFPLAAAQNDGRTDECKAVIEDDKALIADAAPALPSAAAAKELGIKLTNAKPGRRHMTGKHRFADAGAIGELERPKNGCA